MIITDEAIDALLNYSPDQELTSLLGPLDKDDKTTENILGLMTVQNENNLIMALKSRGDTYPTMTSGKFTEVAEDLDFIHQAGFSGTRWGKYFECDLMWNDGVIIENVYHDGIIDNSRMYFNWITTEKDKLVRFEVEEDIKITTKKQEAGHDLYIVSGSIDVTAGLAHSYLKLFTDGVFLGEWSIVPNFGRINDVGFLYDTLSPDIKELVAGE